MAKITKIKSIGNIPLNIDPDVRRILTALKERAEILFGDRASDSGEKYQSYAEFVESLESVNQALSGKAETDHGHEETYYTKESTDKRLSEMRILDLEDVGFETGTENAGKILFVSRESGAVDVIPGVMIGEEGNVELSDGAVSFEDISVSGLSLSDPIAPAVGPGLIPVFAAGNCIGVGFDGAGALEEKHGEILLPGKYLEGSDVVPFVSWMPAVAGAGDVKWQLEYSWQNDGEAFAAPTTVDVVSTSSGTAWQPERAAFAAVSGSGMLVRSKIVFRVFRDSVDGDDTYGSDAVLLDVGFTIQVDGFGMKTADSK